jgi:hypothetical protein
MGSAGPMTINSGRLLETCRIETACPPLLVTTTFAAELVVVTVTDPKLSEAGLIPTPAWIGVAKNTELTKTQSDRQAHQSRLIHAQQSFVFSSGARAERGRGHVRSRIEILISRGKVQLVARSDLGQVFFGFLIDRRYCPMGCN